MTIGDLVKFESGVSAWSLRYQERNPGLVLGIKQRQRLSDKKMFSMVVLWSTGEISSEHSGYLRKIS